MTDAIDSLITRVLDREGGYVNDPTDHGGATKYGITQGTLAAWRGTAVTPFQVQTLSEGEARDIYRKNYFSGLEGVTDPKVLEVLFDLSVNSGPRQAVKVLQGALGVVADGVMGPKSNAALKAADQSKLYWPIVCARLDFYLRIIANDPSQSKFAAGWANRIVPFWKAAA